MVDPELRSQWLLLVPLGLVTAILEAAGALLIMGMLRAISDPASVRSARLLSHARSWFANISDNEFAVYFALALVPFFIFKNTFRFLETYARHRCAQATVVAFSSRLLAGYLFAPYSIHLRRNSANLVRNVREGTESLRAVLTAATAAVSEVLLIISVAAILLLAMPGPTLIAVTLAGILTLSVLRWMQTTFSKWGVANHVLNAAMLKRLREVFSGLKEITILGREEYFIRGYEQTRRRAARIAVLSETLRMLPQLAVETLFVSALAVAIATMMMLAKQSNVDMLVMLGLVGYALMRLLPTVHLLVFHLNECRYGEAAVLEIFADFNLLGRFTSGAPDRRNGSIDESKLRIGSAIKFEEVTFKYEEAPEPVIKNVSFSIQRGECVGIVGTSGAGKTTVIDLMLGLFEPDSGCILVDGIDLRLCPRDWQARIGYVAQHSFFIDDTLRRNIAVGIEGDTISEARLQAVLKAVQLESTVAALPAGVEERIGENGIRLSGGERQRLAAARALYRDPDVLVFDEPTSALDAATERAWMEAICTLGGKKTIVIVAHRVATLRDCDKLIVLRNGEVADIGSYDELLHRSAEFRELERVTLVG